MLTINTLKSMIKLLKCVFKCSTKLALKTDIHKHPQRTTHHPAFKNISLSAPHCSLNIPCGAVPPC